MTETAELDLPDYCANCANRHGRNRFDVITKATAATRSGGRGVTAWYCCPHCGHVWTCWWSEAVFTDCGDSRRNQGVVREQLVL